MNHGDDWSRSVVGRRDVRDKGVEVGASLSCFINSTKTHVAGAERTWGDTGRLISYCRTWALTLCEVGSSQRVLGPLPGL